MVENFLKENLGTIVSTIDGPSPSRLDFVVNNGKVHKGMFVELDYSEGTMLCMVDDIIKTNRYFERPDSVKTIGSDLEKNFPVSEWEFLLARTKALGVFDKKTLQIQRSTFPPSPGTKVFIANNEHIKNFLGIDENGLLLGKIPFHDIDLKPKMSKLLQKHLAVLAMSGSGKSFCTSVIIEELLKRKKEDGQIGLVVFDTHGEYTSFGEPVSDNNHKDFSSVTRIIDARKIKISASHLSKRMLSAITPSITHPQKRELSKIILKLNEEMKNGVGPFDLNAIKSEIMSLDSKMSYSLLGILEEVSSLNLFGKIDEPLTLDIVKPGQLTIINLNNIISEKKKQLIVSFISQSLFNSRQFGKVCPFALLVEEAHNFIPEMTSADNAVAKPILRTIAREGRKFGAALVVISQRPKRLDTTTLANCNTNIILRITNPYDLDHIKKSCEGLDNNSMSMISSLRVGEAIMVGEAVSVPTFFKVRYRESAPSKHEMSLEDAAKKYSVSLEEKEDEVNTFL